MLLPVVAGRCWSQFKRGDGETALREAQLEPDEGYRRFELALAQLCARRSSGGGRGFGRSHRPWPRSAGLSNRCRFMPCAARTEKAFEWLQISFDNHDTGMLGLLVDPLLRDLRDDPRYRVCLRNWVYRPLNEQRNGRSR